MAGLSLSAVVVHAGGVLSVAALGGLVGVGLGASMPILTIVVQNTVPYRHIGVSTSLNMLIRRLGASLATGLLGAFIASGWPRASSGDAPAAARSGLTNSMVVLFAAYAVICLVALGGAFVLPVEELRERSEPTSNADLAG